MPMNRMFVALKPQPKGTLALHIGRTYLPYTVNVTYTVNIYTFIL